MSAHLFIRIIVASLMVPLMGLLLAFTLYFSDQSGLTDQDIAKFLLTPAGAVGAIVIVSLLIVAVVLDVVVATAILRQCPYGPLGALKLATRFILHSVPRLLPFIARFLVRLLIIALPFLAVSGGIAFVLLTEYDINYYLTEHPPEFLLAVGVIGLILLCFAVVLLRKLASWAIALHLVVLDDVPHAQAFTQSRIAMEGHRRDLVLRLLGWIAVRALAATVAGAIAAGIVTWLSDQDTGNLRSLAIAMIVSGTVYSIINAFINAVSNGALADLLNDEFDRYLFAREPSVDLGELNRAAQADHRIAFGVCAMLVLALVGLGTGGLVAEQVKAETTAVVIGHRGAASHAPENTMASVERAIADGADWVEIDVQESAEGEIIVVHDSDFMKSAKVPTKVWDVTEAELADIDIGSWFDPSFADQRVPLLKDVLEAARDQSGVIIELKYYGHDEDLENRVVALVEEAGMADQISTMSLKYPAVQKMLGIRPDWRAGVLAATSIGDLSGLEGDFLALNQARINALVIQRADQAGKDVYAWTVNDPLSMTRMLWIGVDGLITDDPALARKVIEGYNAMSVAERVILALSDRVSVTLRPEEVEELRP